MRPERTKSAVSRVSLGAGRENWRERSAKLFSEFERPARAMVRRAFRSAFGEDELDDIYANAWLGTLRALETRHGELSDEEIRSYVLTAVANQASRELRRRKRKPTAPLELVDAAPDPRCGPEERATDAEASRITRDLLASMPPRRRAVMLLRYGWGLEPKQVCDLVSGLSPRAYRKEITRGVDELTEKMRAFESGEWCADREPVLKSFAAGLADADTRRQAQAHMSHCRECSEFVARLSGHLHDLGSGLAVPAAIEGLDGHISIGERISELLDRTQDVAAGVATRGGAGTGELVASGASLPAARGAGVAGAGVFAKLAGLGTAGKALIACIGGGAAATACVAAGLGPLGAASGEREDEPRAAAAEIEKRAEPRERRETIEVEVPAGLPSQVGNEFEEPPPPAPEQASNQPPDASQAQSADAVEPAQAGAEALPPEPAAATATAVEQEFGVEPAPASPPPAAPTSAPASGDGGGGGGPVAAGGSEVQAEFGP